MRGTGGGEREREVAGGCESVGLELPQTRQRWWGITTETGRHDFSHRKKQPPGSNSLGYPIPCPVCMNNTEVFVSGSRQMPGLTVSAAGEPLFTPTDKALMPAACMMGTIVRVMPGTSLREATVGTATPSSSASTLARMKCVEAVMPFTAFSNSATTQCTGGCGWARGACRRFSGWDGMERELGGGGGG